MLDSHPEITGAEGFEFMVDLVGDDGTFPPLDEYWAYLETHHIFGSADLRIDRSLDYPSLVDSFLRQRLDRSGKHQVAAMVHFHFRRLLHIWPDARFIRVLRDPRDVARSVVQMGWQATVWHGLDKWLAAEREWDRLVAELAPDRFIEVAYADLIGDHVGQLTEICAFLGVEYTPAMLDYAADTGYDVPDPTRVARWGTSLSETEIRLVEGRVGDLLVDRGFEPSGLEPLVPTGVAKLRLDAENLIGKWRSRIETYGLRLFLERWLARVVPVEAYRRSVQLRFNAIERANRRQSWRNSGTEFSVRSDRVSTGPGESETA